MFDKTIVITTPGTKLAVDSAHYTLRSNGKKIGRIPPTMVRQFIIHHGVEISPKALQRASETGVPITLLNRSGRIAARLNPPWRGTPETRIEQIRTHLDPRRRLVIAKRLVDAKIANSSAVILRYTSNYPNPTLSKAAAKIQKIRDHAMQCEDIPSLMGHEGLASRLYFSIFHHMLRVDWATFTGRNRRPPRDPVNALLSYTYAVLTNEIHSLAEGTGLDPYVGFLHGTEKNRANLALDLMEPFRQLLADRLCLRLINLKILKPSHFGTHPEDPDPKGIFLTREGRLTIIKEVLTWADQCDREISENSNSPRGLLTRMIDSFTDAAAHGDLLQFRPYYLLPADAKRCHVQEP